MNFEVYTTLGNGKDHVYAECVNLETANILCDAMKKEYGNDPEWVWVRPIYKSAAD